MAQPDLETLSAQILATVERAKADDPRELRRRIGELEKKLKSTERVGHKCDHQRIIDDLNSQIRIKDRTLSTLHTFKRSVSRRIASLQQSLVDLQKTIEEQLADHFIVEAGRLRERGEPAAIASNIPINRKTEQVRKDTQRVDPLGVDAAASGISRPQRTILNALAALDRQGVSPATRQQVAVLAGYASNGGAFGNLLGAMRTAGLVEYPAPGICILTAHGRNLAHADDCVPQGANLVESWCMKLGEAHGKLLRILADAYPQDMSKTELAEKAGAEVKGGAFGNKLGKMRTLNLIEYPEPGRVKASRTLFSD